MAKNICKFDLDCKNKKCWRTHTKRDSQFAPSPTLVVVQSPIIAKYVIPVPYTNCPHCMAFVFSGKCTCRNENIPDIELQFREIEELYNESPEVLENSTEEEEYDGEEEDEEEYEYHGEEEDDIYEEQVVV